LIEQHRPAFRHHLAGYGLRVPYYVIEEFEAYLKCDQPE